MASFSKDVLGGQPLTDVQDSVVTMVFGIGAAVAAFPPVMDASVTCLGRKGAVIAGGAIFCLGSAMQAVACNLALMVAGRIIAGFSVGLLSGNAPVYTSEIAPPHLRGALVTGFQFAITVGIMLSGRVLGSFGLLFPSRVFRGFVFRILFWSLRLTPRAHKACFPPGAGP